MHELALAQQVVRAVLAEMERRGASVVRAIDLEVGGLEGLRSEDVRGAFEVEAAGTPLEGTVLRITVGGVRAFCPACGTPKPFELPAAHLPAPERALCPDCGAEMDLEGSRGVVVRSASMVLEDP